MEHPTTLTVSGGELGPYFIPSPPCYRKPNPVNYFVVVGAV